MKPLGQIIQAWFYSQIRQTDQTFALAYDPVEPAVTLNELGDHTAILGEINPLAPTLPDWQFILEEGNPPTLIAVPLDTLKK